MKKSIFTPLILTAVVSLSAFAAQGVYGSWKLPQVVSGPLTIDMVLVVAPNSVTTRAVCSTDGKSSSVEASAPATITPNQIIVTGSAQNSTNKDGVNCNASIQPGTVNYTVSADDKSLTLSAPGQPTLTLPRQ